MENSREPTKLKKKSVRTNKGVEQDFRTQDQHACKSHSLFYMLTMNTWKPKLKTPLKKIFFIIIMKKIKYLDINLTMYTQVLDVKNYKMLLRELKEELNKCKEILHSGIGRLKTVKMSVLPN